jgi:hypothetical protein
MREASVHTGRTRNTAPAALGRLGNEHHHRNRRAHLDERVRRGYHPRREGRYDSGEDRSLSPEPPDPQAFSRAIRRAPFSTRFRTPTTITKYSGETRPELWLADYRLPANWVERTMTTSSSATSPCSSPTPLAPGWSTCLRGRSPTGTTWSKPLPTISRARTCALGTPGISEAADSSRESLSGLHPMILEAAHRAAQHHRFRCHRRVPRRHHLPRPGEQAGLQDPHQGERADGHRHQVRLWPGGG